MIYENFYQEYEQEQNRQTAECEQKFIDLRNKCKELNDFRHQTEWYYNAFYMQPANLQNDIFKKQAECFQTWNELCEKFSALDTRYKQTVLQHCYEYMMLSLLGILNL